MTDEELLARAHAGLTFNAPLSGARAAALLRRLELDGQPRVLDLGCGWGELLLRACAAGGGEGDGVDTSRAALERGRTLARERGLETRVRFHEEDAARWDGAAERVLCVGAAHAWGGAEATLRALRRHVAEGGRALFGDGIWEHEPHGAARAALGELPTLAQLAEAATAAGFRVLHHATSTREEWDDFESDWRAGLELSPEPEARALADERRAEYLTGYRGVAGHAWLVLAG